MKSFMLFALLTLSLKGIFSQNIDAQLKISDAFLFNINKLSLPINNAGIIADVLINGDIGGKYDSTIVIYSGGFWISGKHDNEIWTNGVASATRIEDYLPGNVGSDTSNIDYKIYVVASNDVPFGVSWQEWRKAVDQGADFYDGNNDGIYNPIDLNSNGIWDLTEDSPGIIGDLTAWCVYNDAVDTAFRAFKDVTPKGIEIQQTVFAHGSSNLQIENIIYIRYKIINTGSVASVFDSVYFSAWTDPDLGYNYTDDLIGTDTALSSVYVYNDSADYSFGINPPSFFHSIIQGPISYIPGETFIDNNSNGIYDDGIDTPLDTAKNNKGLFLGSEIFPGAKNLEATSSMHYLGSHPVHGSPYNKFHARNYMKGLKGDGEFIDPCSWPFGNVFAIICNNINPLFVYSGNPESNIGWINTMPTEHDMLVSTGPFKLTEENPIDIIVAYVMGRGSDHLNSITKARYNAEYALAYYNSNFTFLPPVGVADEIASVENFRLYQNYPNPFNPITNLRFTISDLRFVELKVYDILGKEIATLVNEVKFPGDYTVEFNGSRFASGVYFYELKAGAFVQRRKMILIK